MQRAYEETLSQEFNGMIEDVLPTLDRLVQLACFAYRQQADRTQIQEFSQEIVLLLIENDYHRLRSFRRAASLKTWLKNVVFHHISHQLKKQQRRTEILDQPTSTGMDLSVDQEARLIWEEEQQQLHSILPTLTNREQALFELLCRDDLDMEAIAENLGVKIDSIYRGKHALIKKLRSRLGQTGRQTAAAHHG